MSAWSEWKAGLITDDEYESAMRRECGDDYPEDEYYTDDADDPHWRCENCNHNKCFQMYKRVIKNHPFYWFDKNNIQHEDRGTYTLFVRPDYEKREMEDVWLCEIDHREHMDDDFCDSFEEVEREQDGNH